MSPSRCLLILTAALTVASSGVGCVTRDRGEEPRLGAEFRTGLPLEPGFAQQFDYATRWARDVVLGDGQSVFAARVIGDLLVVTERPDNIVTAIDLDDGSLAWKTIVGEELEELYAPIGDEDHVYVNSSARLFTLNRLNGELTTISNLTRPVDMSPIMLGTGTAVFGSVSGRVFAYEVDTTIRRWAYALEETVTATPITDGAALVFAVDSGGHYVMLEAATGELRWRGSTFGRVSAEPVWDRSFVLVASEDQALYSFSSTTGQPRWPAFRSEVPLSETPVVIDGVIYLIEPGRGLTAIDSRTGEARWTRPTIYTAVAARGDRVVAYNREELVELEPETGRTLRSVPLRPLQDMIPGPDGSLLLIAENGQTLRIDTLR
ncbi:MAG: PQQ-binding-like beta-propeller repeat protein [Planctomycetota bacterium]